MKLRCYCCGTEITDSSFVLVSFGAHDDPSDRVMVFSLDHAEMADEHNARELVHRRLEELAPERDIDIDDGC